MSILPVSINYSYEKTTSPAKLSRFITRLENRFGLEGAGSMEYSRKAGTSGRAGSSRVVDDNPQSEPRQRVSAVRQRVLGTTEVIYTKSWNSKGITCGLLRA